MMFLSESLKLPDNVFLILRDLIHEHTGLYYELRKREILADRLSPRLVEHSLSSFLDYYYLLKYDPSADEEWRQLFDVLTVPETFFWREYDQIETLTKILIPESLKHSTPQSFSPLKIWSAACSTGEEPITLAISLYEAGILPKYPIRIYASDASSKAISKARSGIYQERSFRNLPPLLKTKYFIPESNGWRICPEIHDHIQWFVANLRVPSDIYPLMKSNYIFCRNVFIYFSEDSIRKTVKQFFEAMPSPGYLFLSSSESLLKLNTGFNLKQIGGAFVYVKP